MVLAQLADSDCRRIITATTGESKTPLALCKELNLPTSTLYRKVADLKKCSLLMVERIVIREDGKKEPSYVCTFEAISVRAQGRDIQLELVLSSLAKERRWFELFFSRPRPEQPDQPEPP